MAEVLVQFDGALAGPDGRAYVARVCGREDDDRRWEGWIEFDPRDGSLVLRTPRETTQPDRAALAYWATGLTTTYLTGALERARHPRTPDLRPRALDVQPSYDGPAPSVPGGERAIPAQRIRPRAVLDPFDVYAQGETVLHEELGALDESHLRNIAQAYDLVEVGAADLEGASRAVLVELIVAGVRRRAG